MLFLFFIIFFRNLSDDYLLKMYLRLKYLKFIEILKTMCYQLSIIKFNSLNSFHVYRIIYR